MAGLPLTDRVRSAIVRGGLRVEPMFLHIERRQLRWFGYLTRMPPFTGHYPRGGGPLERLHLWAGPRTPCPVIPDKQKKMDGRI